jgi:hypothetical protein
MIITTSASEIDESVLNGLIETCTVEGKQIEFKREVSVSSDSEKREFLSDISSFANASGGHIIFGMIEEGGVATSLPGLSLADVDAEVLRIQQISLQSISPRIPGLLYRSIALANGKHAIVATIPQSWILPHMVTYKGSSRFYTRNSAGKHQMDIDEIRNAVLMGESLPAKIRDFRASRISYLISGNTPIAIHDPHIVVVHSIPAQAFQTKFNIDIDRAARDWHLLSQLYGDAIDGHRINLDGLLTYLSFRDEPIGSYTQLYRDGIVESATALLLETHQSAGKLIPSTAFEQEIMKGTTKLLRFQKSLGVISPVFLMISLLNVEGFELGMSIAKRHRSKRSFLRAIDRPNLILPEVVLDDLETDDIATKLRPIFDSVWNALGWPFSMNYDEEGNWRIW